MPGGLSCRRGRNPRFALVSGDVLDGRELAAAMAGSDLVFHLAANADVRFARENPRAHFEQNALATFWVLEAMRGSGARRIVFSSTGVVYGEPDVFPTPENVAFPVQTSLYGAAKLASEALIQAYCAGFGFQGYIFRMVSLLGERYTHGLIIDCYKKLLANPHEIELLGNGQQRKSYLYVQDAIDAILLAIEESAPVNIFNLGSDEYCTVDQSVDWICQQLALKPAAETRRRGKGLDRRQPFRLPGLCPHPFFRLEAPANDPRSRAQDAGLFARKPAPIVNAMTAAQANHERTSTSMDVCIIGLWHQGIVGAAVFADLGYSVVAADHDAGKIALLNGGRAPLFEPGLDELIQKGLQSGNLRFSSDVAGSVQGCPFVLIVHDTPVNDRDESDRSEVLSTAAAIAPGLCDEVVLYVTAQVPVGTCDRIAQIIRTNNPALRFGIAYSPENLRLGQAIDRFRHPALPVIGSDDRATLDRLEQLLAPLGVKWERVGLRTAEMTKHALNAFLATSICLANELGNLCDEVGADGRTWPQVLRLEPRIGPRGDVLPGLGFAGGTLARDMQTLRSLGDGSGLDTPLLDGIWESNGRQNRLVLRKLKKAFGGLKGVPAAVSA